MAATDLLTLDEAKDVLEVSSIDHDDELDALITGVSRRLDDMCGPVVARTITGELHDGGQLKIRPKYTPIYSVTTLKEYDETTATTLTAETNSTKPADGYLLDGSGKWDTYIIRRSSNMDARFASGRRNIELTYEAGRYADTSSVSELFKRAAALFITHLWKQTAPSYYTDQDFLNEVQTSPRVPGFGIPNAVTDLLGDELLPVVG